MSEREHTFKCRIEWTGSVTGPGIKGYGRDHVVATRGKAEIPCSADASFLGDGTRYNPEELLAASLSSCHMLWYLYYAAEAGIRVVGYRDDPEAVLLSGGRGPGRFTRATLRPVVTIAAGGDVAKARALHDRAHHMCFVSNSVNFPVSIEPEVHVG